MRLRFGDCLFDSELRLLVCRGEPARLTPKAFQLLGMLLEERPRPVSKTDLLDRLWPDCHVADANLPNLVGEVRKAIGDQGRTSSYIRTVHGFGYAFHGQAAAIPVLTLDLPPAWLEAPSGKFPLEEGENPIGRSFDCRVRIECNTVSRHHARVVIIAGEAFIEDLGSKNGTYLDGARVEGPCGLADGDKIRLGAVSVTFKALRSDVATDSFPCLGGLVTPGS